MARKNGQYNIRMPVEDQRFWDTKAKNSPSRSDFFNGEVRQLVEVKALDNLLGNQFPEYNQMLECLNDVKTLFSATGVRLQQKLDKVSRENNERGQMLSDQLHKNMIMENQRDESLAEAEKVKADSAEKVKEAHALAEQYKTMHIDSREQVKSMQTELNFERAKNNELSREMEMIRAKVDRLENEKAALQMGADHVERLLDKRLEDAGPLLKKASKPQRQLPEQTESMPPSQTQ